MQDKIKQIYVFEEYNLKNSHVNLGFILKNRPFG